MRTTIGTAIFALALVCSAWAVEYSDSTFQARIGNANTPEEKQAVYNDFVKNAKDMDIVRVVQDAWRQDDADAATKYFEGAVKKNPKSAKFMYLLGRMQKTEQEKIDYGRKTVALDPKFPYGYRLVLTNYMPVLSEPNSEKESVVKLRTEMIKDTAMFSAWATLAPREDMAQMLYYQYLTYQKKYDDAEKQLDRGKAMKWQWASSRELARLYALKGQYLNSLNSVKEFVSEGPGADKYSKADMEERVDWVYIDALTSANANEQIIKYLSDKLDFNTNTDYLLQAAFAATRMKNLDKTFELFNKVADAGGVRMENLETDDIAMVKNDPRWAAMETKLKAAYSNSADKRREKVIAGKVNEPAPDWELSSPDGKTVKLSSLKGSVVVLDFWATWCGPCKMSMPLISAYTEKKPAGARVFSIDVWERGKPDDTQKKALEFMQKNKYAMELLYGTMQTPKDYQVSGIPSLFVIDKQGNIRYKEVGYSPELSEKLPWWVDDLLKN